jgi:hypothetical protein
MLAKLVAGHAGGLMKSRQNKPIKIELLNIAYLVIYPLYVIYLKKSSYSTLY